MTTEDTLKIDAQKTGADLTVSLDGKINAVTAPELQNELKNLLTEEITKIILDFAAVTFLSSAGIRTILWTVTQMNGRQGTMILKNVTDTVKEVFVLTELDTALNFE